MLSKRKWKLNQNIIYNFGGLWKENGSESSAHASKIYKCTFDMIKKVSWIQSFSCFHVLKNRGKHDEEKLLIWFDCCPCLMCCFVLCVTIFQIATSLCRMLRYKFSSYKVSNRGFFLSEIRIEINSRIKINLKMHWKSLYIRIYTSIYVHKKGTLKENLRTLNKPAIERDWNETKSNGASLPTLPFVFIVLILSTAFECKHRVVRVCIFFFLSAILLYPFNISMQINIHHCLSFSLFHTQIQTCLW